MCRFGSMRVRARRRRGRGLPLLVAAALLLGGAPQARAQADDDEQRTTELTRYGSEIELGFLWNNRDSYQFGNYTGLYRDGFFALGNVDTFWRGLGGEDDARYLRLQGLNLGLKSRYVGAEYGVQGRYGLHFAFDQLPVFDSDTAKTFFRGTGGQRLTLPRGDPVFGDWRPGPRADQPGDLQDSVNFFSRPLEVDWRRRRYGGGVSLVLPANLEFAASYDYETKKGSKLLGSLIGQGGGNPRSVTLPEPLNYITQSVDAALRYRGEDLQLELGYYGSFFRNDDGFHIWENPYTAQADSNPTAGFEGLSDALVQDARCVGAPETCGFGRMGQPPDNMFNQIVASGGYNLPRQTRVRLSAAFGWMTQDDDFLPYTVNPNLQALSREGTVSVGTDLATLPRLSLDGEIFTTVVDFGVSSRPLPRVRLDLGYRFDNRENNTPRNTYVYIRGDSENQGDLPDADWLAGDVDQILADLLVGGQARVNRPYSFTRHEVRFDAGYQLPLRSELVLGYEWQQTERDFQEVSKLWQNSLSAILTGRPTSFLSTRISYEYSWRNGSSYVGNRPFVTGRTPEHIADEIQTIIADGDCAAAGLTVDECLWESHPLLRKYYLADRKADQLFVLFTFTPLEDLSLGLNVNWGHDDYGGTRVGLRKADRLVPGVDVSYQLIQRVGTYAFYSYEMTEWDQIGWEVGGDPIGDAMDPTNRWTAEQENRTHTAGVGVNWEVLPHRLSLGADYLFADSRGDTSVLFPADPVLPYPDTRSLQHNVSLHTEYRFTANVSMRVGYRFGYLKRKDYAFDDLTSTSLVCSGNACVIGTGQESEDYRNHVVSWSMVYRFW